MAYAKDRFWLVDLRQVLWGVNGDARFAQPLGELPRGSAGDIRICDKARRLTRSELYRVGQQGAHLKLWIDVVPNV